MAIIQCIFPNLTSLDVGIHYIYRNIVLLLAHTLPNVTRLKLSILRFPLSILYSDGATPYIAEPAQGPLASLYVHVLGSLNRDMERYKIWALYLNPLLVSGGHICDRWRWHFQRQVLALLYCLCGAGNKLKRSGSSINTENLRGDVLGFILMGCPTKIHALYSLLLYGILPNTTHHIPTFKQATAGPMFCGWAMYTMNMMWFEESTNIEPWVADRQQSTDTHKLQARDGRGMNGLAWSRKHCSNR